MYLPVIAAVEVFDDVDIDGFGFLIAEFDLEGFVEDAVVLIDVEVGLASRAFQVESVAGADLDGVFRGCVVDGAFADELHLEVGVAAKKADAVLKFIRTQKHKAWLIGKVVKGRGKARVV